MSKTLKLVLFLVLSLLVSSSFTLMPLKADTPSNGETLTITTYYPSPFGSYRELRAKRVAIGDNHIDGAQYSWDGASPTINANTDLIVEGDVGIGTNRPLSRLAVVDNTTGLGTNDLPLRGLTVVDATSGTGQDPTINLVNAGGVNSDGTLQPVTVNNSPAGGINFGIINTTGGLGINPTPVTVATIGTTANSVTPGSESGTLTLSTTNNGVSTPVITVTPQGNVGINTTTPQGVLDVRSPVNASGTTTAYGGLIPPRMTTAQRNAIANPVAGMMIYNTNTNQLEVYSGGAWNAMGGKGQHHYLDPPINLFYYSRSVSYTHLTLPTILRV